MEKNYQNEVAKILINIDGEIQDTYSSITSPTSKKITNEIEKILNIK